LGWLEVRDWGTRLNPNVSRFEIVERMKPRRSPYPASAFITSLLLPETEHWTDPGHPSPREVTRFRLTAIRVRDWVAKNPGRVVGECLAAIDHHWGKGVTARSRAGLNRAIEAGAVDGVGFGPGRILVLKSGEPPLSVSAAG
jgi:hypothetical protein